MYRGNILILTLIFMVLTSCQSKVNITDYNKSKPKIPFNPEKYTCYRSSEPIVIDGKMDDKMWQNTPWTCEFGDIEGELKPKPYHKTRAKMLWDDNYFYFAAEMEEPHIWAKLRQRDTVIFYDNDFEIFIDPDGDTHWYYEFEMNAFNTIWDLILKKPYRDGSGVADNSWTIHGIKTAVHIDGTINNPNDTDKMWSVEVAMPWEVLKEYAPENRAPKSEEYWRVGFSRVQWITDIINGNYVKRKDPKTGKRLPEHNWTWSKQGTIAMHKPERWNYVMFTDAVAGEKEVKAKVSVDEEIKWALRQMYYVQRTHRSEFKTFTSDKKSLHLDKISCKSGKFNPTIKADKKSFEISQKSFVDGGVWKIRTDGKVWKE